MSGERVNVLKRRSEDFLKLAKELIDRKMLDIASFSVHQACQLRIKASLLRLTGSIPRTHGIRELMGLLANSLEEEGFKQLAEDVRDFVKRYRDTLIDVEYSYTESRYGLASLPQSTVNRMVGVAEELFKFLEGAEKYVLG
ncbi:MAG: hypothetical protein B9J98_02490 [Candidatus Terraquivivens tikiterensis]|uniref:HEPN domain-containing protein n=1 Tax=Candidatus Terraquivivens tikiterensis TaxID=1980982 RepID=A0A2R7Y8F6_9ARCH|nr:MAG: hypothetical protein B9J98_02490 [Candidatus Terraquivivens tikiterensis]